MINPDLNRETISDSNSFKLVIKKEHLKIFKAVSPFLLISILFITVVNLFKESFLVLYVIAFLITSFYILYVYNFYRINKHLLKTNSEKIKELKLFKCIELKDILNFSFGFYVFNLFFFAIALFYSRSSFLILLSMLMLFGVYSTRIVIARLLRRRKLSLIELLILFVIGLLIFIYEFREILLYHF